MLTVQRQQLLVKPMAILSQNAADILKQRYMQQRSQRYANYMCQHVTIRLHIYYTCKTTMYTLCNPYSEITWMTKYHIVKEIDLSESPWSVWSTVITVLHHPYLNAAFSNIYGTTNQPFFLWSLVSLYFHHFHPWSYNNLQLSGINTSLLQLKINTIFNFRLRCEPISYIMVLCTFYSLTYHNNKN